MRPRREDPFLLRDVLLEDVVLQGAVESRNVDALASRRRRRTCRTPARPGRDGHRRRRLAQIDAVEQHLHVSGGIDGDPAMPDLAQRARVVGIETHQRRHVEGHGQPVAAFSQDHLVPGVGLRCGTETRELPYRPGLSTVSAGVQSAGERILPRPTYALEPSVSRTVVRSVNRCHLIAGQGGEITVHHPSGVEAFLPALTSGGDIDWVHTANLLGRPTTWPFSGGVGQLGDLGRRQPNLGRGDVLLDVAHARRPRDRENNGRAGQQPRECDL